MSRPFFEFQGFFQRKAKLQGIKRVQRHQGKVERRQGRQVQDLLHEPLLHPFSSVGCRCHDWKSLTRAITDTGASENKVGIDCLNDLVHSGQFEYEVNMQDLPVFVLEMAKGTRLSVVQTCLARPWARFPFTFWEGWPNRPLL